jgi:hypothetical protein
MNPRISLSFPEVRMRTSGFILAAAIAAGSPTISAAQTVAVSSQAAAPPPAPRWFIGVNGGAQAGGQDAARSVTFDLYEEQAVFESSQSIDGGAIIDVGAAGRLYRNYGVGVAYTAFSNSGSATFGGSLPHPLVFDQPRTFSGTADVDHKERAVHVQAVWFVPFTDKVDFALSGGPSFFTVEQGFVRGITFGEVPPDFNTVTVDSVDVVSLEESGVGFNVGVDMTYAFTRLLGAGVTLRFTRGSLDFDLGEGQTASLDAGGFQFGAGVRVRF